MLCIHNLNFSDANGNLLHFASLPGLNIFAHMRTESMDIGHTCTLVQELPWQFRSNLWMFSLFFNTFGTGLCRESALWNDDFLILHGLVGSAIFVVPQKYAVSLEDDSIHFASSSNCCYVKLHAEQFYHSVFSVSI